MKISRSNYEIWFIDRLDGNLDDSQLHELDLFLSENPDLREEFDDLAGTKLNPPDLHFKVKGKLLKSPKNISAEQFEHLCVASLENDLSPDQHLEFQDLISEDTEKQKTFELISRTRLSPPPFIFPHKKKLLRRTPEQKVMRLSLTILSVAALIALILLFGLLKPRTANEINSSGNRITEAIKKENNPEKIIQKNDETRQQEKTARSTAPKKFVTNVTIPVPDSIRLMAAVHETPVEKIRFTNKIELSAEHPAHMLAASPVVAHPAVTEQAIPDERSNVGRFLAKNFRQKIMKENVPDDRPLKSYEIAEASVSGLNRLFGWDMALTENTDEQGQVKSVRFSSKLLKFNAPLKNSSYTR